MLITFQQFWKQNNLAKSLNSDYKEEYKEMLNTFSFFGCSGLCYSLTLSLIKCNSLHFIYDPKRNGSSFLTHYGVITRNTCM